MPLLLPVKQICMHWVIASLTKMSMGYSGLPYNYEGNISEKGCYLPFFCCFLPTLSYLLFSSIVSRLIFHVKKKSNEESA